MLSRFLTLSPELLVQIISYLSFKDIISCEMSCRHLKSIVKNSFQLKYLKEAGRSGVYDPLTPGLTFPERIEKLRRWEKAWEDLNIPETTARITFDLDIWSPLIGSLHNGHLVVTDADPVVYAFSDLSRLPRILPIRSIEFGNLTLVREGLVHAFAFADEYDLVVIISTYVLLSTGSSLVTDLTFVHRGELADSEHFSFDLCPRPPTITLDVRILTLSESLAHPLAKNPQIDVFLKSRFLLGCTLDAKIAGNCLVILTCHIWSLEFDEVHLIYWREGTVHCVRMFSSARGMPDNIQVTSQPTKHLFPPSHLPIRRYPRPSAEAGKCARVMPNHPRRSPRIGYTLCSRSARPAAGNIVYNGRVPRRPNRAFGGSSHALTSSPFCERSQCHGAMFHPRIPTSRGRPRLSPICFLLDPAVLPARLRHPRR